MSALMGLIAAAGVFCVILASQAVQYVGHSDEWREDRRVCLTIDGLCAVATFAFIFCGEWFA